MHTRKYSIWLELCQDKQFIVTEVIPHHKCAYLPTCSVAYFTFVLIWKMRKLFRNCTCKFWDQRVHDQECLVNWAGQMILYHYGPPAAYARWCSVMPFWGREPIWQTFHRTRQTVRDAVMGKGVYFTGLPSHTSDEELMWNYYGALLLVSILKFVHSLQNKSLNLEVEQSLKWGME